MSRRDYYDVLGLSRGASEDEIRNAYRALARKHHPDVSKAPDAQERFTEVQEAYDVLSDPEKRGRYDQFGHTGVDGSAAGPHYSWGSGGEDLDFDDLGSMFDTFFSGRSGFGGGGPGTRKARARKGSDRTQELTVTFVTAARGGKESIPVVRGGKQVSIDVTIPAGIPDGARLRVAGGGQDSSSGGAAGDLILVIRVGRHPIFRREQGKPLDLLLDLPLTISEAVFGATVSIPTLEGTVDLRVPAGTAGGKRLRLRGRGIHASHGNETVEGDLYAIVQIIPPDAGLLSEEDEVVLRSIGERQPAPRVAWD